MIDSSSILFTLKQPLSIHRLILLDQQHNQIVNEEVNKTFLASMSIISN